MYKDTLEKLIDLVLVDGKIGKDEKNVLLRKALEMGIDKDEFSIVLNARMQMKQKELGMEVSSDEEEEIERCPACHSFLSPLSKVCPSCAYVLDRKSKVLSPKALQDLIMEVENTLLELKKLPADTLWRQLGKRAPVVLPVITVLTIVLGIMKKDPAIFIIVAFLTIISIIVVVTRNRSNSNAYLYTQPTLTTLRAQFEKQARVADMTYGESTEVKDLLKKLSDEFDRIEALHTGNKIYEVVTYGAGALVFLLLFLMLPDAAWPNMEPARFKAHTVVEADSLILIGNYDGALELANDLDYGRYRTLIKCKAQLTHLNRLLDQASGDILPGENEKWYLALSNIHWIKVRDNEESRDIEMQYFDIIRYRVDNLSKILPKAYQVSPMQAPN